MPAKKVTKKAVKQAVKKKTVKSTTKKTVKKPVKKKALTVPTKKTVKKSSKKKIAIYSPRYYELIAKEAYFLFERSGFAHGQDQHNWYEAEKRVKKQLDL